MERETKGIQGRVKRVTERETHYLSCNVSCDITVLQILIIF